jgi:hyperosmotically inducible periplasmic protein
MAGAIAIMAVLSGCAMAMLGGAARSGGGSASSSTSGGTGSGAGTASAPGGGASGAAGKSQVSDSSISAAVRSRFSANASLKALKIVVDTHDGIVTLRGQVNTVADKSAAQAEARVVVGVTGVNNQLTVR